ncbi:hypothetical protein ACFXD5_19675 [Streptomyces sp. NPDC059385]|uniref:hypothetical protein n=1 Tax=Streptomyces sp. NPDC059385 TaxID=3346817 RepID=UPI003689ABDB
MSIDTTPINWDLSKVIPGEVVTPEPAADGEDDIAPGVLEVRPSYPPVLRKAGGAAMVVAAVTGKAIGITARATWTGSKWFGAGFGAGCLLGWRYVRAHDHQEVLGGMTSGADWNKVKQTRLSRWKFLGWTALVTPVVDLLGWWAITAFADIPAAYSWPILPGLEAAAAVTALTAYGRYRLNAPDIAPQQLVADMDNPESDEPYPLAWCTSPGQVHECVSRALYAEGIEARRIDLIAAHSWGYEVDIELKGATAEQVGAAAKGLEGHLNIKKGGALIDPDPQASAHLVLRLVTSDPFANMPKSIVHAPNSLDISDPHHVGYCMDGSRLEVVFEGTRTLVIGVSGAAKSTGVLRDHAEIVTACHNAIALDLDPVKDGLREFEGVMAVPPIRGKKNCTLWLGYLVRMAEARNVVRNRLGMGDTWIATREHPAIYPYVDEFIYLDDEGKELFIELLRLGKQVGMYPTAAGQDATSGSLGAAIADSFTLRIMLASRHADIPLVFGQGAIAEGFRPDRLQPAQTKDIKNDAGRSYIKGAGLTRPLLYGWNEYSRADIDRAVKERAAAGRPWFDHDTLAAADLLHVIRRDGKPAEAALADRLDGLDHGDAPVIATLLRAFGEVPFLPTTEVLLPALEAAGVEGLDSTTLAALIRKHAPDTAAVRQPWDGKPQVRGWLRAAVEQAAAGLIDPSTARLRAA